MKVYLAVPYTHPDKEERERRFQLANKAAMWLKTQGHTVFSPISHSHPVDQTDIAKKFFSGWKPAQIFQFWLKHDIPFMKICDVLCILRIDGHDESFGVATEVMLTEIDERPVWNLFYDEETDTFLLNTEAEKAVGFGHKD